MKKTRLVDIAAAAGVGIATVERVLNERGGVRPQTIEKVVLAAKQLGYKGVIPNLYRGTIRIEVILVRPETPFFSRLNRAFERIAASLDSSISLHRTFVEESDPEKFAAYIANSAIRRHGLIVVAVDHPKITESLRQARASGVEVVQIVSYTGGRDDVFVGIDNYAAGRTAGFYMSRMLPQATGSIVAVCHSWAYRIHKERVRGFSDYVATQRNSALQFSEVVFGHDDDLRSAEMLTQALRRRADIVGVYNAGGANLGVGSVLQRYREREKKEVVWIAHELNDETRDFISSGLMTLVLDQAPETQARRALDTVLSRIGIIDVPVSQDPVPFLTFTSENIGQSAAPV
ncbi:LacI family DNA-binding transcriptional regulator [Rhizobium rhizogenes]|uniref:LacI family DNA-binding transcriptional regulator n=1 Tax=Rhizobium rhizogenes TaxID=359 RepID=UPI00157413E1|nr:LacI family DNA-binding transcriptional regulator [Rhizobium rhizogenes]NTF46016.1 LacI family DNA-binding transcriptional regulator [Rhizobium rhizogenes]